MKPPLKFALFSVLYAADSGIWEYEIYEMLKPHYTQRALSKIRSILIEFQNKSWTHEMDVVRHQDTILTKYRLQDRHREFIQYQLEPQKIIDELGLQKVRTNRGGAVNWEASL